MNSDKLNRRKRAGKAHDPEAIVYGQPAPGNDQKNNQPLHPGNFKSQHFSQASMSGKTQNPFMDAEAFVPQLGAPGGDQIAKFSGNFQNNVPGTGLNRMPPNMQPAFPQQGSAPDWDQQESMRINQMLMAKGLYGGPMGLSNPGQMPAPGSVPGQMPQQTANTMPPQGISGGLPQGGEAQLKNQNRGARSKKGGMTT